jgi:hypothetical protein
MRTPAAGTSASGYNQNPEISAPPPLSPAYVKDTIAALTSSRRALGARLDNLQLFTEHAARPDDPVEIQLLFAARDDYIQGGKSAMANMIILMRQARAACADVAGEMNRLLISAMAAETAQKKINAMLEISARKRTVGSQLTLADMLENADDRNDRSEAPGETESAGRAPELQAEPRAGELPPV